MSSLLTEGLQKGFGGETNIEKPLRGRFQLTSSHYENNGVYHDEWLTGGGQELARTATGEAITRTYVGNVISAYKLEALGIKEKDIMVFLKKVITKFGSQIRFDSNFETTYEDWTYSYKVTYKRDDPFIINGIEEIYYEGEVVFVHTFGISKIVEE